MQLTQQFQNFDFSAKDITSDYGFLLRLVNTFTEKYPSLKVHDFTLCAHKSYVGSYCRLTHLKKNVVQYRILLDLIRRISNYIFQILFTCKGPTKIKPFNIQSRSSRTLRTPADMVLSIYLKPYLYLYSYKIETAIFIATKHEKTIMVVI